MALATYDGYSMVVDVSVDADGIGDIEDRKSVV